MAQSSNPLDWSYQRYDKSVKPTLRNSHSVVSNHDNSALYLFGGRSKGGCNNHLYILTQEANLGWQYVQYRSADIPPPRKSSGMVYLNNCLYIFGGSTSDDILDDFWKYELETGTWVLLESRGHPPQKRDRHSMSVCGERIYIFGGHGEDQDFLSDLYVYDASSGLWSECTSERSPPARYEHAACAVDNMIVIAGGKGPRGGLGDIWVYEHAGNTWYQPAITGGYLNDPRWGQSLVLFQRRRLIFFGGWNGRQCFNDLHSLDVRTWAYQDIPTNGQAPAERTFHGCGLLDGQLVIVAGRGRERRLNDTHMLDLRRITDDMFRTRGESSRGETARTDVGNLDIHVEASEATVSELNRAFRRRRISKSDFDFRATLGTGSFGRVRLVAFASGGDRPEIYAMKMLRKSRIVEMKQEAHIKSEKRILQSIRHPFIVNLEASFQDSLFLYLTLEYIPGGEFFSLLRKTGTLRLPHAAFYASQIVLVFHFLHNNQIVYRDLKPENLLIGRDGYLKLTDFGFAKRLDCYPYRTWTLCGTPEYIAPEILLNKGHSFSVDWWALGILLFEMFTGNPPFVDEVPMRIYQKILDCRIEYPRALPGRARDFISKLLTPNLSQRLGNLANGAIDVMKHPFFEHVNWRHVLEKKVRAPYLPPLMGDDDTRHFDRYDEDTDTEDHPLENDVFADDF